MATGADGGGDAVARQGPIGSRGEKLQNAVFDDWQADRALAAFGGIRPRIDNLFLAPKVTAASSAALDVVHIVDEDVADFGRAVFGLGVEHGGIIRGVARSARSSFWRK